MPPVGAEQDISKWEKPDICIWELHVRVTYPGVIGPSALQFPTTETVVALNAMGEVTGADLDDLAAVVHLDALAVIEACSCSSLP